jgi:hypothetical protein
LHGLGRLLVVLALLWAAVALPVSAGGLWWIVPVALAVALYAGAVIHLARQ